jgi:hypothetical protein
LDIGYSLLAAGYSKRGGYQEMVLTSFKEDNWRQKKRKVLTKPNDIRGEANE